MKILLVDDDSSIIQALLPALKSLPGHEVHVALSAEKALERAPAAGGIDLLITDVVMQPMDGFSLREQLAAWYPGLRVIFISGYDLADYADRLAGAQVLAKPFGPEELLTAVRAAIAGNTLAPTVAAPAPALEEQTPEQIATPPAAAPAEPEPVVHSAAPQGGSPSVSEARGELELTKGSFDPAPSIGAQAALPEPELLPPVHETAAPAATHAPAAAAAPVPVARPVAMKPAAKPVSGIHPAPVVRATAVPVARGAAPKAVAVPRATAAPVAAKAAAVVPVAKPAAVPTAKAAAVPVAKAVAAAPAAVNAVAAAPRAVAAPARPAAAVAPVAVVPPPPVRESHSSSANLIGQTIGGYQIVSQLGEGRWGSVFAAVQTSINRPVGLKVLDPDRAADEAQKQRFIADARAKAHVQHPGILSVYEAGSAEGWIFYTHEYVDGENLAEMAAKGRKLDEPTLLKLLKTAAESLAYYAKSNIPHTPFQPSDIYLSVDGQPRLSNLATQLADQPTSMPQEIESLGRALLAVVNPGPGISTALRALLGRTLRTNANALKDWAALLQGVKALEPKVVPLEAAKISAQERAAQVTVDKARKQQKRAFLMNVAALVSLLVFAVAAVYFVWIRSNERKLDEQIHIPAGEFISGDGKNSTTGEFWIDKYEVTIGEYAKFVRWVDQNAGGEEHAFDHPKQPRQLSHIPNDWGIYYTNARKNGAAHSTPIDLNSPVMTVTWWDAYAYAKWKGRDLPTELEWEKAARGTTGNAFPWGEEADARRANTNADYNARNPAAKGGVDGFNFWGDVDAQSKDKSPYGVIGMAGNVSEWTVDWAGDRFPVIKGGNFSVGLQPLSARIANRLPADQDETIGFRTISRTAPTSK